MPPSPGLTSLPPNARPLHTHKHEVRGVPGKGRGQEWLQGRGAEQRAGAGGQARRGPVVGVGLREVGIQEGRVALPRGGLAGKGLHRARGADVVCKLFRVVEV